MEHLIPQTAIDRYSAGPSQTTVEAVQSLHLNIRDLLGSDYETFLQGSYRNDTGVADLNDVDIVALSKTTVSLQFTNIAVSHYVTWEQIFERVQAAIESAYEYRGKTDPGDKCITVNTNFKADVVPAVKVNEDGSDPIAIYSFRDGRERLNYPRQHYKNNSNKNERTLESYKPTVRMFKKWVRNWYGEEGKRVAPSFYVECLIYSVPDNMFIDKGAWSFFAVAHYITSNLSAYSEVTSVAGDKNVLTEQEWHPDRFLEFQRKLAESVQLVASAIHASNEDDAMKYWRAAFNE